MRFGILGATTAWRADGTRVPLGGPTPRALLALLLARAGQVVSADFLIDSVYGERPPADATHALQSQISRLRRSFTIELLPAATASTSTPRRSTRTSSSARPTRATRSRWG
ncbi:AfsR/SARP family transcriptional regulator [Nonomuraea dietziae]|uniref:AfsR/SARP family transcriptional regulator n=1 Tax=Nonomuraea dietziae TaxID=65515 RepID=UPI003415E64D